MCSLTLSFLNELFSVACYGEGIGGLPPPWKTEGTPLPLENILGRLPLWKMEGESPPPGYVKECPH